MVNREGKQLKLLSAIIRLVNLYFFNNFIILYIIIKNKFYFCIEEKNLMNDVTKQLKFMIKWVFLIPIVIEVKLNEHMNQ